MVVENDDGLELSLNLNSGCHPPTAPFPLCLFGSSLPFKQHISNYSSNSTTTHPHHLHAFQSSTDRGNGMDDEAAAAKQVSSPNSSTVSSVSGNKRSSDRSEEIIDDDDDDASASAARKKLRLCKEQSTVLEDTFRDHNTLNPRQKMALAKQLNLRPRQVEVWFQNRRARTKLKQTEVDCEYLRRCCENLTEENRRLQKEVNELRALKLSPKFYLNMTPPTTLTMCTHCERVAVLPSPSPITTTGGHHHHHHHPSIPMASWPAVIPPQPHGAIHLRS